MIKRLYFLINSALEADFKRLKLEEIDFKVIENRTPLFNPFNLATKYFLSKKFKQKHYFYYLVLKLFHKVWNVKDELDLLFTKNPSTSKNIIFIAHDRILNSIWSEHLEQFKDNISIFTINTDRNFNKINTLISKHCKILSPISCSPKLIVVGNCLNVFLLKAIRKAYPSAHIAVWFYDDFSEFLSSKNIEKISSYKRDLNKLNINIWDYNKVYSSRYNFTYQPNAVNFNYLRSLSNLNKNNNYIFYAGSVEPVDDRFDFLYHFLT